MLKIYGILFCLLFSSMVCAWNAVGHRVIAQIAYDNLDKKHLSTLRRYNRVFNQNQKRKYNLVNSSVWLDTLYFKEYAKFKLMHYIDLPFVADNINFTKNLPAYNKINAVWAIKMANQKLHAPHTSLVDKGLFLRILLHVVGDVHQPLHAATKVSDAYPLGDHGGNLVFLQKNAVAPNLHAYWDRGGGLLNSKRFYSSKQIKLIARQLEAQTPCDLAHQDLDPMHWALESHKIAVDVAYKKLPSTLETNISYQKEVQQYTNKRIAIAGCRLAAILMLSSWTLENQ